MSAAILFPVWHLLCRVGASKLAVFLQHSALAWAEVGRDTPKGPSLVPSEEKGHFPLA